jgi:hypothetical protein
MKLSENTVEVLKNFSTINPSLSFRQGNVLRTVSPQKNILAASVVEETFPVDFAIYELNQFLGLNSIFEEGDIQFGQKGLEISEGSSKCRYTYTDPSMVTTPPEKDLVLPTNEVQFDMSRDTLKSVVNAANQLSLPEIAVRGDGTSISLVATDTKNPSTNEYSVSVSSSHIEAPTDEFSLVFKTENFKFIPDDYSVTVSSKGISHFKGERVEYWVATEAGSKYGS